MEEAPRYSKAMGKTLEEWRPVPGFEGLYQVSSLGNVKSMQRDYHRRNRWGGVTIATFPEKTLKPSVTPLGYRRVVLQDRGKVRRTEIHRLVCEVFHGSPPSPSHHAAHIDGTPGHDGAHNVRWATPAENARDRIKHGTNLPGEENPNAKLSWEQAQMIRSNPRPDIEWAKEFGVSAAAVWRVRTNRGWRG